MNLGLAELEDGNLDTAIDALRRATLFGKDHPEAHFNLALVYMQRGCYQTPSTQLSSRCG